MAHTGMGRLLCSKMFCTAAHVPLSVFGATASTLSRLGTKGIWKPRLMSS